LFPETLQDAAETYNNHEIIKSQKTMNRPSYSECGRQGRPNKHKIHDIIITKWLRAPVGPIQSPGPGDREVQVQVAESSASSSLD
jgi:hypothetical protein